MSKKSTSEILSDLKLKLQNQKPACNQLTQLTVENVRKLEVTPEEKKRQLVPPRAPSVVSNVKARSLSIGKAKHDEKSIITVSPVSSSNEDLKQQILDINAEYESFVQKMNENLKKINLLLSKK